MKREHTIIFILFLAIGVAALLAKAENGTPRFDLNGSAVSALEARLAVLEEKVAALENANDALARSAERLGAVTVSLKKDRKKKEFNGDTCFIIPSKGD